MYIIIVYNCKNLLIYNFYNIMMYDHALIYFHIYVFVNIMMYDVLQSCTYLLPYLRIQWIIMDIVYI